MFGSYITRGSWADTWVWRYKTNNWYQVDDWDHPYQMITAATADQKRDEVVAVSLEDPWTATGKLATRILDENGRWRRVASAHAPSQRSNTQLVYHAGLGKVLLWGGFGWPNNKDLTDIWLWDGKDWTEVKAGQGPVATGGIAYDSRRETIVALTRIPTTWEWNVKTGWVQHKVSAMPPISGGEWKLVYDPARARTVWFSNDLRLAETWEWDGTRWQKQSPKVSPPSRAAFVMDYSPDLGGVLVYGGIGSNGIAHDTWLWDGKTWTDLKLPLKRGDTPDRPMASAYDVGRQRWLVFFGCDGSYYHNGASNAWQLAATTLRATQPYPHLGERFDFAVDIATQANQWFVLALALSPRPGIPLRWVPGSGAVLLPLAPDPLFWLSLQAGLVTKLDASGKGRIPFAIPNDPSLLWLEFHAAGWTLDPTKLAGAITNRQAVFVTK